MKPLARWTSIFFYALTILFLTMPQKSFALEDAIIAVVNDELITLKDLKDFVQSTYVSLVAEGVDDAQIKTVMKDMEVNGTNKLIEDKLILSRANIIGIEIRESLIDDRIDELKIKYGSEQNLVGSLVKNGATLTDLRNKIRDQLKTKFLIQHEIKNGIYVNPLEVTEYYEANKDQFIVEDRINLASIFISFENDKPAALSKTVEAFKRVHGKNDFQELIKEYSDAPSIGIIMRGQLLPEVETLVFNLNIDETSPIIELGNGVYIFKLIGKIPAKTASLEDVKAKINDLLYKDKFKKEFITWLNNLKKDAYIEIKQ